LPLKAGFAASTFSFVFLVSQFDFYFQHSSLYNFFLSALQSYIYEASEAQAEAEPGLEASGPDHHPR
jgi:hypothetical protein